MRQALIFGLALAALSGFGATPAPADVYDQIFDWIVRAAIDIYKTDFGMFILLQPPPHIGPPPPVTPSAASYRLISPGGRLGQNPPAAVRPSAVSYHLSNLGATLQAGEPTEGGLMTRTIWADIHETAPARYVIHTFGSDIDTVLAAYKGRALSNIVRLTGNDNTSVPGIGSRQSLIQFDTLAGANYRIQAGSRNQAEGDISLNVFRFPSQGGLAAFLIQYGAAPFNGQDYVCDLYNSGTLACPSAKFIVYNGSDTALSVTPTTTLGAGVSGGTAFKLERGALKVVTFSFTAGFDHKTVRTVSGNFVFTGKNGAAVISVAKQRAIVVVGPQSLSPDLVRSVTTTKIQTSHYNEAKQFSVKVSNIGAQTAIGCHFETKLYGELKTTFYQVNPATGVKIGNDNAPVDIPAGKTRYFAVNLSAMGARDGDFVDTGSGLRCANSWRADQSLQGGYDVTTSGYPKPLPSLAIQTAKPAGDILTVPPSGAAYYDLTVANTATTKPLTALVSYEAPFDDPPDSKYGLSVCQIDLNTKACLAPYGPSVDVDAVRNTPLGFRLKVTAPTAPKPLAPDHRRIYLKFKLRDAPYILIAAPGIAPRVQ